MKSKYRTFDGEEIEDGWYMAQYKTEREIVYIYGGKLFTGPWLNTEGPLRDVFTKEEDNSFKHHKFKKFYLVKLYLICYSGV